LSPRQARCDLRGCRSVIQERVAPALHGECPSAATCWDGCIDRRPTGSQLYGRCHNGSIFWPWIGRRYRPGGVCPWGGTSTTGADGGADWSRGMRSPTIFRQQFQDGYRRRDAGDFGYRSSTAAAAVLASFRGHAPRADPASKELVGPLEAVARVQAVKCAPLDDKSNPSPAMCMRCPPKFLVHELQTLRPGCLIVWPRRISSR
jgi:hypothetical protein